MAHAARPQTWDARNVEAYEKLGHALVLLGDPKAAVRAFASIAEVSPASAAHLHRAGMLLLSVDPALAIDIFRLALAQRDSNPNIYRGLALAQVRCAPVRMRADESDRSG